MSDCLEKRFFVYVVLSFITVRFNITAMPPMLWLSSISFENIKGDKLLLNFGAKFKGGRNLTTSLLLRKSQNLLFLGPWNPVGIIVYRVCLIHVSFKCFEPRPYLVCRVTTIENV